MRPKKSGLYQRVRRCQRGERARGSAGHALSGLGAGGSGLGAGGSLTAARGIKTRSPRPSPIPSPQPPAPSLLYSRRRMQTGSTAHTQAPSPPQTPSVRLGGWLFKQRSWLPVPIALILLLTPASTHSPLLSVAGLLPRRRRRIAALVGGPPHRRDLPNEKPAARSADCDRAVWSRQKSALPRQHRALARLRVERPASLGRSGRAAPARRRISRDRQVGGRPSRRPPGRPLPRLPLAGAPLDSVVPRRHEFAESFPCRARALWRETLFSERGTLIAIAVGYLAAGSEKACWGLGARGWGLTGG